MTVKLALRGLRGESAADIARRSLSLAADTTDEAAITAFITQYGADELQGYVDEATTIAELAGVSKFYDTLADATADLANIAADAVVHVWEDEDHSNHRTAYRKESGSLVFKKDLDNAWMASALGGTIHYVESYVDPANGIMADTLGLRAAIAAAGSGGVVRGKRGRTYTLCGTAEPAYGQIIEMVSTKRCDAITATTVTGITSGVSTSVTVDDASAFRVGMDIAVQSSATAGTGNRRITSIVGNVITVSVAFDATIASGATLTTSFSLLANTGDGGPIKVRGCKVDGNKANNAGFTRWPNHNEIAITGAGCCVEYNYVHDCLGEGIEIFGDATLTTEVPFWCQFNRVEECNGNGIHTSASYGARILFNFIRNTNLRPNGNIGHDDGCISFSDETGNTLVMGNHLEGGLCGVGALDAEWNSPVTIAMNTIVNCDTVIEGVLPGETASRVHVVDNLIVNSGLFSINETSGDTADGARDWIVARNTLIDSRLAVVRAQGLKIADNIVKCAGNTSDILINLANCQRTVVEGNQVTGGAYGIFIEGVDTKLVRLKDNDCFDQYNRGVSLDGGTLPVGEVDIVEQGVFVAAGYATDAAWLGVVLCNGSSLRGGKIKAHNTSSQAAVLCPDGGAGVRGAIVTGVVIVAPDVTYAVRAGGGSKNNIVVGNFSDGAFSNAGGTDNTFENNYELTPV